MKERKRRLEKLEKQINGNENERVTLTLGGETLTFKNADEIGRLWVEAVLADYEEEKPVEEFYAGRPDCERIGRDK